MKIQTFYFIKRYKTEKHLKKVENHMLELDEKHKTRKISSLRESQHAKDFI